MIRRGGPGGPGGEGRGSDFCPGHFLKGISRGVGRLEKLLCVDLSLQAYRGHCPIVFLPQQPQSRFVSHCARAF